MIFSAHASTGEQAMTAETKLDINAVLDGLGQGVLIFSSDGRLLHDNLAARTLLGKDFNTIRENGWEAASALFNARQSEPDLMVEQIRERALQEPQPLRFHIYLAGEYVPCWMSAIQSDGGSVQTMVTLDTPDWSAVTAMIDRFRDEMGDAIDSTQGHIELIERTMEQQKSKGDVDALVKRVRGFTRLISIHMHRVGRLNTMLERLEDIRTGKTREVVRQRRRKIDLEDFFEDFAEELDEIMLVDPETESRDHRSRLKVNVEDGLAVSAARGHLTTILQDLLRNAIMYSMKATPVTVTAQRKGTHVQIDMTDEGYGVRDKERERIFTAFQRARQPQIISEFGYGLSLYLCKQEIEAMNGRIWFESKEGIGSTFSFMLPVWQDAPAPDAESSENDQT